MKKVTSITWHVTGEGDRLSFTYSEIDDLGKMVRSNIRENYIILDGDTIVADAINSLKNFCEDKLEV